VPSFTFVVLCPFLHECTDTLLCDPLSVASGVVLGDGTSWYRLLLLPLNCSVPFTGFVTQLLLCNMSPCDSVNPVVDNDDLRW
jgi:hypothetical protein